MPLKKPFPSTIKARLNSALRTLIVNDRYLLDKNLHERTIVHKFATYLQIVFPSWHVDVEYNRNIADRKALSIPSDNNPYGEHIVSVFPDIIIHRRGSNEDNLLVIEAKKSTNQIQFLIDHDYQKLACYMQNFGDNNLGYKYGCHITFIMSQPQEKTPYKIEWI